MNNNGEFQVGSAVSVRDEYRNNPSLQGASQGTVTQVNRVGITMTYTLDLDTGKRVTVTAGVLEPQK